MRACDLERYADRHNPAVIVYNLFTLPGYRARGYWEHVKEVKDERLLRLVSPDPLEWKVRLCIRIANVDYGNAKGNAESLRALRSLIRTAVVHLCGHGLLECHVDVEFWGDVFADVTVSAHDEIKPTELQEFLCTFDFEAFTDGLMHAVFVLGNEALADVILSGDAPTCSEVKEPACLISDRSDAIFKVCYHSAWCEQNTRDWDGAQGTGTITGTAWGYKHAMAEDRAIVDRFTQRMGFDVQ